MYEPQKLLEKYKKRLSALLGIDVSKGTTLSQTLANDNQSPPIATLKDKLQNRKQLKVPIVMRAVKEPDYDDVVKARKTKARDNKMSKRKQRPPTSLECREVRKPSDSLNCKKYIGIRMETAGENSEYDSIEFLSMYRMAQPFPLRQIIKKIQIANAQEDQVQESSSNRSKPVSVGKKTIHESQVDLVNQYLTQHRKEQLAKDKKIEIMVA